VSLPASHRLLRRGVAGSGSTSGEKDHGRQRSCEVEYVVGGESRGPTRWSTGAVEGREENGKQRGDKEEERRKG
jgi:hypothetical protein